MTQNQHDTFVKNIPAYVLGALSRAEASSLRAHLETCKICQAELARYQQVGNGLMGAVFPLRVPPSAARAKLMASIGEKQAHARPKNLWNFKQLVFGFIALALISLNLFAFLQIRNLRQQQMQLVSQVEQNHTILGMLTADTEVHPITGDGFSGNLLLDREKNLSFLLAWNLPSPPDGQVYQIWLVSPQGERIDAGSFRPEGKSSFTSTALVTSRRFTEFIGIEVTVEPAGGSDAPTGNRILSVDY